jgi:putative DNA primase/helicase
MITRKPELRDQAQGRWRAVLPKLGVPAAFLDGKQRPCPVCGGKDRARFDDLDGHGTWICNQCGAGDGMSLAMKVAGLPFADMAKRIRELLPDAPIERAKPPRDETRCIAAMRELWSTAMPISGTMAEAYLRSRHAWTPEIARSPELRFIPRLRATMHPAGFLPALLARVTSINGRPVNIHRTFLEDGAKAYRAMMPGSLPEGCAIRLMPATARMGVAEGIETAVHATRRFRVPVWATISAGGMERWTPPPGTDHVHIFGDCDRGFAGQASAYILARKLSNQRQAIPCNVHIPDMPGTDWADEQPQDRVAA